MPTNANTFNSRVTSEALEAKFRQVFPAQGGAELVQDLFASGVIQPVVDFSTVAEGSILPAELQQAWDFSTGFQEVSGATTTLINNTGFWKVDLTLWMNFGISGATDAALRINDGTSTKVVWRWSETAGAGISEQFSLTDDKMVVFLRSGDSLEAIVSTGQVMNAWYRQIADVNGTLVNPLGFTFS